MIQKLSLRLLVAACCFITTRPLVAGDDDAKSTKVTGTVVVPKSVSSFTGRTLEIRLYAYNPFLADVSADLVEKRLQKKFAHTQGKDTTTKFVVGAKGKLNPKLRYYLTVFLLENGKRTHIGEKDGKRGLCKVLTGGNPNKVRIIARQVGGPAKKSADSEWSGSVMDLALQKLAPRTGYIADAKTFARIWKAWNIKGKMPKINFKKHIAVFATTRGSRLRLTPRIKDGDLRVLALATRDLRPGFRFAIKLVERAGIKTVNGKPIQK